MSRIRIGLRAALSAAKDSELHKHRVGAVVMRGTRILSVGYNLKKTHPDCPTDFSQHAEFNACSKVDCSLYSDLTIYIARLTRTNRIGLSRPCEHCEKLLFNLGIMKVHYTNNLGALEVLRWN